MIWLVLVSIVTSAASAQNFARDVGYPEISGENAKARNYAYERNNILLCLKVKDKHHQSNCARDISKKILRIAQSPSAVRACDDLVEVVKNERMYATCIVEFAEKFKAVAVCEGVKSRNRNNLYGFRKMCFEAIGPDIGECEKIKSETIREECLSAVYACDLIKDSNLQNICAREIEPYWKKRGTDKVLNSCLNPVFGNIHESCFQTLVTAIMRNDNVEESIRVAKAAPENLRSMLLRWTVFSASKDQRKRGSTVCKKVLAENPEPPPPVCMRD